MDSSNDVCRWKAVSIRPHIVSEPRHDLQQGHYAESGREHGDCEETGHAVFYSRSRNKLWLKGETSGHKLVVKEISTDCDRDAVLLKVEALGPGVCHEGYESCFFRRLEGAEWKVIEPRAYDPTAVYG